MVVDVNIGALWNTMKKWTTRMWHEKLEMNLYHLHINDLWTVWTRPDVHSPLQLEVFRDWNLIDVILFRFRYRCWLLSENQFTWGISKYFEFFMQFNGFSNMLIKFPNWGLKYYLHLLISGRRYSTVDFMLAWICIVEE